jgi:uroporphyrinogen decarboxylase
MTPVKNNLLLRALRNESTSRTPVWMMRQAGRTDPMYRELRQRVDLPLEAMFRDSDISVEASLLPKRIGVDGIIIFQDILTPLTPMGADFLFRPGPQLKTPIRCETDIEKLRPIDPADDLAHVCRTIRGVRAALDGDLPVIGFAGAPLTLAMFLIEGKSPGRNPERVFSMMRDKPASMHKLLSKLADMTVAYLRYQIEEGVQTVQLFESMADIVTTEQYATFAHRYHERIFAALSNDVPKILFAKERSEMNLLASSGADVISIGNCVDLRECRATVEDRVAIQGNVDNQIVATGSTDDVRRAVRECIDAGGSTGHVLNLSHGLLQNTPFENVQAFVDEAHRYSAAQTESAPERSATT